MINKKQDKFNFGEKLAKLGAGFLITLILSLAFAFSGAAANYAYAYEEQQALDQEPSDDPEDISDGFMVTPTPEPPDDLELALPASVPFITAKNIDSDSAEIVINDQNPESTMYQLISGTKYVSQEGKLVDEATWIKLVDKTILITGLEFEKAYELQAKAKSVKGTQTASSNAIQFTTKKALPPPPKKVRSQTVLTYIRVMWNSVKDAKSYEVEVDGEKIVPVGGTSYVQSKLVAGSTHSYRVRAINANGAGDWSNAVTATIANGKAFNYFTACKRGKVIYVPFRVQNVGTIKGYCFVLTYNPDELEALDLCTKGKAGLKVGKIKGTDTTVVEFTPGRAKFGLSEELVYDKIWSGVVSTLKFRCLVDRKKSSVQCAIQQQ